MSWHFSAKQKLILSAVLALVGFILMIVGIVRIHHHHFSDSSTLDEAKKIISSYDATAQLRLAHNPSATLKNTTITLTSAPQTSVFSINSTTIQIPIAGNSANGDFFSVPAEFQSYKVSLGLFPPQISITTTFPLHPLFNTSTPEGRKQQDQIDKISVDNVSMQTTGNPSKTITFSLFCDNSSCNVDFMGAALCSHKYRNGAFTKPTDEHGNSPTTCAKDVAFGDLAPGFCGMCQYSVAMVRYCQTVQPVQISAAVWSNNNSGINDDDNKDDRFLIKPAVWTWQMGNSSQNEQFCHPAIGTVFDSGLATEPQTPSFVELVVVNLANPISQITSILYFQSGPCFYSSEKEQQQQQLPCFPRNIDNFPSRGAGVALLVFGVLFSLVGLIFVWYYRLQNKEEEYESVPTGWRQVHYKQENQGQHLN
jgi:hypothetical protein